MGALCSSVSVSEPSTARSSPGGVAKRRWSLDTDGRRHKGGSLLKQEFVSVDLDEAEGLYCDRPPQPPYYSPFAREVVVCNTMFCS